MNETNDQQDVRRGQHSAASEQMPAAAAVTAIAGTGGEELVLSMGERALSPGPSEGPGADVGAIAADALAGGGASIADAFRDLGGPVLTHVHLVPVFWGSTWAGTTSPTVAAVMGGMSIIVSEPYMWGLSQYRGISTGEVGSAVVITSSEPPNPFSDVDVTGFLTREILAGRLPMPTPANTHFLYCVIMPPGVRASAPFAGEHGSFGLPSVPGLFGLPGVPGPNVRYAWVTNGGTLDSVTNTLSHEVAESVTDPEGNGFVFDQGTCSQPGGCEIGDVCHDSARISGILVQSYWSQRDRTCIVPANMGWESLGGQVLEGLAVGRNADGRLEVFGRGSDGALLHIWQVEPNGTWSQWASLGGQVKHAVTVAANADGRLEAFVQGQDDALWHIWQTAPNTGWSNWSSLGGDIGGPLAVARNADGRLEAFTARADGLLWHIWQTGPGGAWSNWTPEPLPVFPQALAVGVNADGRLEVFANGLGNLQHKWQGVAGGAFRDWVFEHEPIAGPLAVARNADGRLEVFTFDITGALLHYWQTSNGGSGWGTEGGRFRDTLVVGQNADGRLEIFAKDSAGVLRHNWQLGAGGWSGWEIFGGMPQRLLAISNNADGRMELFMAGPNGELLHRWQSAPSNGWHV